MSKPRIQQSLETLRRKSRYLAVLHDSALLTRHLLEEAGAIVNHSEIGKKGVEDIMLAVEKEQAPDLILMDMMMPVEDGYTATAKLRENGIEAPIVAMTAFTFLDDREKCLASGCDLYISKPINPANFISQLSTRNN